MLHVQDIHTSYGSSKVLFGVSLTVHPSEVVTLLGRNGMGKSTTIRSIMGLTPVTSGTITYNDKRIDRLDPYKIARSGVGLVPEGRQIFPNLTVRENLMATAYNWNSVNKPYSLDDIFTIFPRLAERLHHFGNQLSGGEQQMLAVGRALMINPSLLILDEATEGLAPLIRKEIWRGLTILKKKGLAILVIDKNLDALMAIAEKHYIMEKGKIVWGGSTEQLKQAETVRQRYLGI